MDRHGVVIFIAEQAEKYRSKFERHTRMDTYIIELNDVNTHQNILQTIKEIYRHVRGQYADYSIYLVGAQAGTVIALECASTLGTAIAGIVAWNPKHEMSSAISKSNLRVMAPLLILGSEGPTNAYHIAHLLAENGCSVLYYMYDQLHPHIMSKHSCQYINSLFSRYNVPSVPYDLLQPMIETRSGMYETTLFHRLTGKYDTIIKT